ncbi:MAG: hypothetical protein OXT67_03730, partial [Zetaproteobacteria bacterium]|nr:hypothetical protein [Zetaproteobacteria bacterium]
LVQSCTKSVDGENINQVYKIALRLHGYCNSQLTLQCYQAILLQQPTLESKITEHIYTQLMSWSDIDGARDVLKSVCLSGKKSEKIQETILWLDLREQKVNIHQYFSLRNECMSCLEDSTKKEEALFLYGKMSFMYDDDIELKVGLLSIFMGLGLEKKAVKFAKEVLESPYILDLQKIFVVECLIYLNEQEVSCVILAGIDLENLKVGDLQRYYKLYSDLYIAWGKKEQAISHIEQAYQLDVWDVDVLMQYEYLDWCQHAQEEVCEGERLDFDRASLEQWQDYITQALQGKIGHWRYLRAQIYLLRFGVSEMSIDYFIRCTQHANYGGEASQHLIALLNTNFDSAWLYWGIGQSAKLNWQLSVSSMWFELALKRKDCDLALAQKMNIEIADTNTLLEVDLHKSVVLLSSLRQDGLLPNIWFPTLAQAFLAQGDVSSSREVMQEVESGPHDLFETCYVRGLIYFRSGDRCHAKKVWKPWIKIPAENLRDHFIKQKMLRLYFHT